MSKKRYTTEEAENEHEAAIRCLNKGIEYLSEIPEDEKEAKDIMDFADEMKGQSQKHIDLIDKMTKENQFRDVSTNNITGEQA